MAKTKRRQAADPPSGTPHSRDRTLATALRKPSAPSLKILVQKFGGTSVATPEMRAQVIAKVLAAKAKGFAPVVVISAMGRSPAPYATDTLIRLLKEIAPTVEPREQDLIMSCGETIAAVVVAHTLTSQGHPAAAITGFQAGILTDATFGDALIRAVHPNRILRELAAGRIVVVTGFQGVTAEGDVTTLGRGGSDTTATALGAALHAAAVEIYTDVDGVMTVDPRIYRSPKIVPELMYEEVAEMATEGVKVLQGRSVDLAWQYGVPLWVKGTASKHKGTYISGTMPKDAFEKSRLVTALAHIGSVGQVIIYLSGQRDKAKAYVEAFNALAARRISLDLINITSNEVYFIVKQEHLETVIAELESQRLPHDVRWDCAKLSIIGSGMRGTPGVMAQIQRTLAHAGVAVLHSTDSNISISCLIREEDVPKAVEALHKAYGL